MPAFVDTVAWARVENGRILCARPRGKHIFYIPGGKREGAETDLQTLLREIAEELTVVLRPETRGLSEVAHWHAGRFDATAEGFEAAGLRIVSPAAGQGDS